MRIKSVYRFVPFFLLIIWAFRYLYVNNGHISAYYNHTIHDYEIGEVLEFGNNQSYYSYTQDGYVMCVQSAKKYTTEEFCNTYKKQEDDFFYTCDSYIELTIIVENKGDPNTVLQLLGIVLRGKDWFCFYDDTATTFANEADASMGGVSSLKLPINNPCTIKVVYGLQRGNFPLSRWNQFEKEKIWLVTTIMPTENRIRINI